MIGRPSIENLLNDLLSLQGKINSAGRFSLPAGRQILHLVSQVRIYFAELNEDAVNMMRAEFEGDAAAMSVIELLAVKTDADSMQVVRLLSQDLVEKLTLLMQQVPNDIAEDVFVSDFGTTRVHDAAEDVPKPFLGKELEVNRRAYLARRSVSTFFDSGVLPVRPEEMNPLHACVRALLDLAAIEGKKGSRTGNLASYMSKMNRFTEAYAKLNEDQKCVLHKVIGDSRLRKVIDEILDKKNVTPARNKAVQLWVAIRENDDVKNKLNMLLIEKKNKRASAPEFRNSCN